MDRQVLNEADELHNAAALAFLRLHRMWGKLQAREVSSLGTLMTQNEVSRGWVLQIVDEGICTSEGEVTVGTLAEGLDIDPSTASRMVSSAIRDGLLVRRISKIDGRRSVLHITRAGHVLLHRFRRQPRVVFDTVTKDWPPGQRDEFARLFTRYVDEMARIRAVRRSQDPAD
ncbi:MarR family winged helix-turn-helix transcriptional regulator [Streptomyces winkii]|uniref:MarR family winged helix-turn-helix transcriptional regulator n=1 Tax=Streptomyces winkii TaxID=3051178 RepID=UPI0028D3946B|nr:MarR family winged helix-turn-helix transcriptional regulator [Streptomyces sp. DSM 40971]